METLVLVVHVVAALALVGLVMLQQGKGADVGAAFGSGASGSLFGATGSANFLSRTTAVLAVVFFLTSLGLTYISTRKTENRGVMAAPAAPSKPVPTQAPQIPVPMQIPQIPVPTQQAPAPATPAVPGAAPDSGSRAQDIPK
ncbi:MAG: preprotein translocase subunit SecG [Betaproteobacteria bacterium]|nr:preprotein translocase subunit SecG [Betaproteobacteria bacterium]